MADYSGRWFTTFGSMLLEQRGSKVTGSYRYRGAEGRIEGAARGDWLRFRYEEPAERGTGEFRLLREGRFSGSYTPRGRKSAQAWDGHRGWDGLWETSFGRLRMIQQEGRVHGFYPGGGRSEIRGTARKGTLAFRYRESNASGEGRFSLVGDGESFLGEWRARGQRNWQPWSGHRAHATPNVTWLVVLEAHWQRSLAEPEYSFGNMLREIFARLPQVRVRQRYFHDGASLAHWTSELLYLAEPVVLLIASHGLAGGLSVHGRLIDTPRVLQSLRHVENLKLLHFSSCLVGQDAVRSMGGQPFPISGYTTSVDWSASALLEFNYLDLVLNRGVAPAKAAARLARQRRLGFRFFPAR